VASRPQPLFDTTNRHRSDEPGYPSYDVSRDGHRFLMIKPTHTDAAAANLVVVTNWAEEVTRRPVVSRP